MGRYLKIDLTGKDSIFLSNCHRYLHGLADLELYRTCPEKVAPYDMLKGGIDRFEQSFEGGINGDRLQIAMRKKHRKEVTDMFNKILRYLESVAEEDDIPALMRAGIEVRKSPVRRRKAAALVAG